MVHPHHLLLRTCSAAFDFTIIISVSSWLMVVATLRRQCQHSLMLEAARKPSGEKAREHTFKSTGNLLNVNFNCKLVLGKRVEIKTQSMPYVLRKGTFSRRYETSTVNIPPPPAHSRQGIYTHMWKEQALPWVAVAGRCLAFHSASALQADLFWAPVSPST